MEYYFQLDYTEEKLQDELLREIKTYCMNYLFDKENLEEKSINELLEFKEFLFKKFNEFVRLKKSLKIPNYSYHISEVASVLNHLTLADDISASTVEPYMNVMTRELNSAIEVISFCQGIMTIIISEKL